eukprot:TRINITY_DN56493_c0_g1_i1.p1 TRINITY_DN56493_c0_g1~~TRINITY_DN56493_c0_g1_i1.p1  ORF type:complete len:229 (-),score=104.88 TRINITY_DN56493_c0_g1_i1:331-1017(-)
MLQRTAKVTIRKPNAPRVAPSAPSSSDDQQGVIVASNDHSAHLLADVANQHDPEYGSVPPPMVEVYAHPFETELSERTITGIFAVVYMFLFVGSIVVHKFFFFAWLDEGFLEFMTLPLVVMWVQALTLKPSELMYSVLTSAPLKFLGSISYSVYCVHFPILRAYTVLVNNDLVKGDVKREDAIVGYYALPYYHIVPVLAIVITVAFVVNRLIENPARRALVNRFAPRR